MNLAVIALPELLPDDVEHIQSLRTRHDPLHHQRIAPHVTLVFPTPDVDAKLLVAHVKSCVPAVASFAFSLRCAMPVPDPITRRSLVYLVPDRGFSDFVRAHDLLYVGALRPSLRLDIPFIPHLRVGSFDDPNQAKQMADRLNDEGVSMFGTVTSLAVLDVGDDAVREVARVELAAAAGVPASRMH